MSRDQSKKGLGRRDFLKNGAAAGVGVVVGAGGGSALAGLSAQGARGTVTNWHRQADVVVIGAGASGLPAAIRARDQNASVIVIEENFDVGGHGMISMGNIALGGGTRIQKKSPKYKIQTPPFYAAWATPILHDTYAGLRVNEKYQVMDVFGRTISDSTAQVKPPAGLRSMVSAGPRSAVTLRPATR